MSGSGDQIEHLIEHIVEDTVSAKLIEKHTPDLMTRMMRQIGSAILKAGNEAELIRLDKAIAQAKQFEDGSAMFLFKEHNPTNRSLLFVDLSNPSKCYFKIFSLNQDNLIESIIYDLTNEQIEEATRQIHSHFGEGIQGWFVLSIALIANVPDGYEFWRPSSSNQDLTNRSEFSDVSEKSIVESHPWKHLESTDRIMIQSDQPPTMPTPI